jgi:hypothetical protein
VPPFVQRQLTLKSNKLFLPKKEKKKYYNVALQKTKIEAALKYTI